MSILTKKSMDIKNKEKQITENLFDVSKQQELFKSTRWELRKKILDILVDENRNLENGGIEEKDREAFIKKNLLELVEFYIYHEFDYTVKTTISTESQYKANLFAQKVVSSIVKQFKEVYPEKIKITEIRIILKELTDFISVDHNKAMKVVKKLCEEPSFGMIKMEWIYRYNNDGEKEYVQTYSLNKKQAIATATKLNNNNALLMKLMDRLEELENQNKPKSILDLIVESV